MHRDIKCINADKAALEAIEISEMVVTRRDYYTKTT